MAINKKKNWEDTFLAPLDFDKEIQDCSDEVYAANRCYPVVLDTVPVEKRQGMGYFFDDEVTAENADKVKFLRVRRTEFYFPDFAELPPSDMTVEELIRERCYDVQPRVYFYPIDFDLPNLEVVVGDIHVDILQGKSLDRLRRVAGELEVSWSEVSFPALSSVDSLKVIGSKASFGALDDMKENHIKVKYGSDVSFDAMKEISVGIEISDSSCRFPELRTADMIEYWGEGAQALSLPSLETARGISVKGPAPKSGEIPSGVVVIAPLLSNVSSYMVLSGAHSVLAPALQEVGGLIVNTSGNVVLPKLERVGNHYTTGHFGSMELIRTGDSCRLDSLRYVHGELEYCHGAKAFMPELEEVFGDMHINCGHWIYVGTGGTKREDVPYLAGKTDFSFDKLSFVGGSLEVFDRTRLHVPELKQVKGKMIFGRDCQLEAARNRKILTGGFQSQTPGVSSSFKIVGKHQVYGI